MAAQSLHDFKVSNAQGKETDLSQYKGKPVLIVNVASKCGFTPQYAGLESLYKKYQDKGFVILGFPCNQFGSQEPGNNDEIQQFCQMNYGVSFPVMAKVDVNGSNAAPVYEFLKESAPGILGIEAIKWNFTKFLVGPDGKVVKRYAPQTEPKDLEADVEKVLS
ncbi:MAG: glutathione peroxidase [Pseudobdellovibrionaceae bacterium]